MLVEPDLTIKHHRDVFVIDDLASVQQDGKPVPRIAPAANQKRTPEPKPFHYADYGNLATIGRMAALVNLRGFRFSGVSAWLFWLAAHVFF